VRNASLKVVGPGQISDLAPIAARCATSGSHYDGDHRRPRTHTALAVRAECDDQARIIAIAVTQASDMVWFLTKACRLFVKMAQPHCNLTIFLGECPPGPGS